MWNRVPMAQEQTQASYTPQSVSTRKPFTEVFTLKEQKEAMIEVLCPNSGGTPGRQDIARYENVRGTLDTK